MDLVSALFCLLLFFYNNPGFFVCLFSQFPKLLYVDIIFSFNVLCHVIFILYFMCIDVQPVYL